MLRKMCFGAIFINYILISNVHAVLQLEFDPARYPFDMQLHEDVLDPELCQQQLTHLTTNTGLLARFLDAGLRVPTGVLDGNLVDLGNFHQCLAISEQAADISGISGKYCRIQVPVGQDFTPLEVLDRSILKFDPRTLHIDQSTLTQLEVVNRHKIALNSGLLGADMDVRIGPDSPLANVSFELAICIPRACTTEQAINGLLFNLTQFGFEFSDISCRLPDDRPWAAVDYVAIVIFSVIGFLTVISTCYNLYNSIYLKKGSKEISSAYTSFSVYTNARRLLTFNSSPGSLECLDGIRALAIFWVILGHSFSTVSLTRNPIEGFMWTVSLEAAWITVALLAVDTFFLLSGLLLIYTTVGKLKRMQLLKNLHLFYLHRLLRMFPILATVVLFEASLYMRSYDGPLWERVATPVYNCRKYWWSTLIHLQNLLNPGTACIPVTWYLAIDVQLHILSPIILFWVLTSRRAAWTALNTGLVSVVTASTVFIFLRNFPSGVISPNRDDNDMRAFFQHYYMNTLTRSPPFMIGMVYGYLLHLWKKKNVKVPMPFSIIFLLFSLSVMLAVMYCTHLGMTIDWDNQVADNFFNSFLRLTWALTLGWIIFTCVDGKAEPINWFLSLQMWKLPARISYAMYLIHYQIMIAFYASIVSPIHFTVPAILFNFMAYLLITMILSFFVTLLIDSPFSTIFKLLLGGGIKKSQAPKKEINSPDPTKATNNKSV